MCLQNYIYTVRNIKTECHTTLFNWVCKSIAHALTVPPSARPAVKRNIHMCVHVQNSTERHIHKHMYMQNSNKRHATHVHMQNDMRMNAHACVHTEFLHRNMHMQV